jgi:RNA polymerase sigma-70 factor (ECF subfamily)
MERVTIDDDDRREIDALADNVRVLEMVDELDDEQAAVIRARYVDERSYGEIAGELGVSEAVVRKRVSRGLQRLRARIGRAT